MKKIQIIYLLSQVEAIRQKLDASLHCMTEHACSCLTVNCGQQCNSQGTVLSWWSCMKTCSSFCREEMLANCVLQELPYDLIEPMAPLNSSSLSTVEVAFSEDQFECLSECLCGVSRYCIGQCSQTGTPKDEQDCYADCREKKRPGCYAMDGTCFGKEGPTYHEHSCYHCEDCGDVAPPANTDSCWTLEENCCLSLDGCYTYIDPTDQSVNRGCLASSEVPADYANTTLLCYDDNFCNGYEFASSVSLLSVSTLFLIPFLLIWTNVM